ncbi:30451_t:CDS:1 [Gigaspora margarita]|uniref:30451_t:CDS:1 n=1 Tax=Gigaspora margarita TaxID=4874 RepID=A0ABN7WCH2_GIGMA|nr:30451_t:CDS:1 [Gigaspora margarita]
MTDLKPDPDTSIENTTTLNKYWHKGNMAVKEAANKHIPMTKSVPRPFYAFSFKATKLHQAQKLSNKARKIIFLPPLPKSPQTIANEINAILQQIGELVDYLIPSISE